MDKLLETAQTIMEKTLELERKTLKPGFGNDVKEMTKILKEIKRRKKLVEYYKEYMKCYQSIQDLKELRDMGADIEMIELAKLEAIQAELKMPQLYENIKIELLPIDPNDDRNVIIEIRGAAGGDEANIFAGDLYKMYSLYADIQGWKIEVMDSMKANSGGFTLISFMVKGEDVYSKLKFENGIHRVQRVPKTESQGRIHTSTASVVVMPEIEIEEVEINKTDLKIDVYRSSGAGGQSVNTTDSAVRITHLPTGIVTTSQEGRSQHDNKDRAMKQLAAKIWELKEQEMEAKLGDARKSTGTGARSEKIRTYNYPQSRVTDHRIGLSLNKLSQIMAGKLDEIIVSLQADDQRKKMEKLH